MANSKNNSSSISKQIGYALSIASLAPSVHNIQPWRIEISENIVKIIPKTDILTAGDPTKRQTYISIGAFIETFVIALSSYGLSVKKFSVNHQLITVEIIAPVNNVTPDNLLNYIKKRHTNRSKFKKVKLTDQQIDGLLNESTTVKIDNSIECKQYITVDRVDIDHYANLIGKALKIALLSKEFCEELSEFVVKKGKIGIPYKSMGAPLPFNIYKKLLKTNKLATYASSQELKNWQSASLIISICSNGDSYKHWIEAGRLYQRCCLKITSLGLDNSTSAALVEALNFHEDIEEMLDTNLRLMSSIRIGKATKPSIASGRYTVDELKSR